MSISYKREGEYYVFNRLFKSSITTKHGGINPRARPPSTKSFLALSEQTNLIGEESLDNYQSWVSYWKLITPEVGIKA